MDLPRVFPVFPLESVLLVPGALLPLHIFEPRYRDMVRDAVEGTSAVALAMPREGHATTDDENPPLLPVVVLGRIIRHEQHEDGRYDIIVQGVARMQIEQELPPEMTYRRVLARPLPDEAPTSLPALRRDLDDLLDRVPELQADERTRLLQLPAGAILDAVLLRMPVSARDKHRIYAETALDLRLAALHRVLDLVTGRKYTLDVRPGDPRLN